MKLSDLFLTKSIQKIETDHLREAAKKRDGRLTRDLGVFDLTLFGIAAIIGAGIFATVGNAAYHGGPGVTLLFVFTAIACGFSALCYAEFASKIPVAGSAYTYAYASLGELVAWIIGWDLLMEYAIGNIAVAISWSDYFTGLMEGYGFKIPGYFSMDFLTASRAFDSGDATSAGFIAWTEAPRILGLPLILDIPALLITIVITYLVYIGIRESKVAANTMVVLKMMVIALVVVAGAFYVNTDNWHPFLPNGISGVMKGVSAVFFAYIGFDAISTTAEECKNPQRDLPRAMFYALGICTVVYILLALVLTGVVNHSLLQVGDPLAFAFGPQGANVPWISGIVGWSAIVAIAGVLLVFQLGQPRIWMSMSRDGLLPRAFSKIHPKFHTPSFATIVTGLFVAIPCLFMNLTEVTDLTSIGTLFAFAIVCAGVMPKGGVKGGSKEAFKVPYVNAKYWAPALYVVGWMIILAVNPDGVKAFFSSAPWDVFQHRIPYMIYMVAAAALAFQTWRKEYSLIPVLGLASSAYLMTELGVTNWLRFAIWLLVGLGIYFMYGYQNSRLRKE